MLYTFPDDKQERAFARTSFSSQKTIPYCKLTLTPRDASAEAFWDTFLSSLEEWNEEFAERWHQRGIPATLEDIAAFMEALALEMKRTPLLLIIDHIERLEHSVVRLFLSTLVQIRCDPSAVILLHSLDKPQSSVPTVHSERYRYYTEDEEATYYRDNGFSLSSQELYMLRSFTEGWSLAVHCVTRRMQNVEHNTVFEDFDSFILQWVKAYYLPFPEESQRNLILLSFLDEFSLGMINQGSKIEATELLDMMENSPFIQHNPETMCFSFSHVYQRFLISLRALLNADEIETFYVRVGNWYLEQGDGLKAMDYYLLAREYDKILHCMMQWPAEPDKQQTLRTLEILALIPPAYVEEHPYLVIVHCYMLCGLYRYPEVAETLNEFLRRYDRGDATPPEWRPAVGDAYFVLMLAKHFLLHGDSLPMLRKVCEFLPQGSPLTTMRQCLYADTYVLRMNSPEAGSLDAHIERLAEVEPLIHKIYPNGYSGITDLARAEMHFLRREINSVETSATIAIEKALIVEQYDIVCSALYLLMRLYVSMGNYHDMAACCKKLRRYAAKCTYEGFFSMPELAESWLNLKLGKHQDVAGWIKDGELNRQMVPPRHIGRDRVLRTVYLIVNRRFEEALSYLEFATVEMQQRGDNLLLIQLLILQSIALSYLGRDEESVRVFEEVYHWTNANGIVGLYPEYGTHLRRVLTNCKKASRCSIPAEWLDTLERKMETYIKYQYRVIHEHNQVLSNTHVPASHTLLRDLSRSERSLLQSLAQGTTQTAMAEQLGISLSGVKKKLGALYKKIGALNRADAIRIAGERFAEFIGESSSVDSTE